MFNSMVSTCCVSAGSGIYYADNLAEEHKVNDLIIYVKFRKSLVDMVCTKLGPGYHHIEITDILNNRS